MRPTDEREKVLNMHFIEKKSAEKICAEVGIPLGKVLKLMRRYSLKLCDAHAHLRDVSRQEAL